MHVCNRALLIRTKASLKQVRVWKAGAMTQGCFDCTDWSVFREAATKDHITDVKDYAEVVSGYIRKCKMEDFNIIKTITNQKPSEDHLGLSPLISGDATVPRSARASLNRKSTCSKKK